MRITRPSGATFAESSPQIGLHQGSTMLSGGMLTVRVSNMRELLQLLRRSSAPAAMIGVSAMLAACVAVPIPTTTSSKTAGFTGTATCEALDLGAEFDRVIDPAQPDPHMASEAVRHFANVERCRNGVRPLRLAPAAVAVSEGYARTMARHGYVGHVSPDGETFARRLNRNGVRYRIAGENVARTPFYRVGSKRYVVQDATECRFSDVDTGAPIGEHTYRVLGSRLVRMWMESAAHRENMLRPEFRAMGAGIAVSARLDHCGHITAASTFLG